MLPYKHTAAIDAALTELTRWQSRLDRKEPLPRAWAGRLRRDLEAEAVGASTIMEGVPVTLDEVRRILAGDEAVAADPEARQLVLGYEQAMNFVLRRADDPGFKWSRELVVGLHDRIMAGRFDLGAGRIRAGEARVVDAAGGRTAFIPAQPGVIGTLLDEVCGRLAESTAHPALDSAWVHVAVAAIHPFKDGNGRTARVLASLAMYRGGFRRKEFTSLEEWWGGHKRDYYSAFACLGDRFNAEADVTEFAEAHVAAQLRQVRALDLRERVERRIWTALEEVADAAGLSPKAANALWDVFFERPVTAGYYRALADVSPATATNHLALAAAAGLLKARGRARGRTYEAGPRLFTGVAESIRLQSGLEGSDLKAAIIDVLTARETTTRGAIEEYPTYERAEHEILRHGAFFKGFVQDKPGKREKS